MKLTQKLLHELKESWRIYFQTLWLAIDTVFYEAFSMVKHSIQMAAYFIYILILTVITIIVLPLVIVGDLLAKKFPPKGGLVFEKDRFTNISKYN